MILFTGLLRGYSKQNLQKTGGFVITLKKKRTVNASFIFGHFWRAIKY
jgi:hypothetical protein